MLIIHLSKKVQGNSTASTKPIIRIEIYRVMYGFSVARFGVGARLLSKVGQLADCDPFWASGQV